MDPTQSEDWQTPLGREMQKRYFKKMLERVQAARDRGVIIYPPTEEVFKAFYLTPLASIRVVILGQDPYHGPNQANGLCFSVSQQNSEQELPPSLKNIYNELYQDISEFQIPEHGRLHDWASRGVFLLNTVLTVKPGDPLSHEKEGWERFTDEVIKVISRKRKGVVFLLWGKHAKKKKDMIDTKRCHLVLTAAHPSPLSAYRGFFGCRHFSKANKHLQELGVPKIDWSLSP